MWLYTRQPTQQAYINDDNATAATDDVDDDDDDGDYEDVYENNINNGNTAMLLPWDDAGMMLG